jgi:hypothetical protein
MNRFINFTNHNASLKHVTRSFHPYITVGYADDAWNEPAIVDVTEDDRFADAPVGYTTVSDTTGDTLIPHWKFRYNHIDLATAKSETMDVDAYVGCYVTKPSAPALSHRMVGLLRESIRVRLKANALPG